MSIAQKTIPVLVLMGLLPPASPAQTAPTTPAQPVSTSADALSTPSTTLPPVDPTPPSRPQKSLEVGIQATRTLSLPEAIELALERSPTLQAARLQIEQSKAQLRVSEAALYPTFSLALPITFNQAANSKFSQAATGAGGGGIFSSVDTLTAQPNLSASWTVFSFGANEAQVTSSQESLRNQELNLQTQLQAVKLSVIERYYDLQQANSNVKIGESAVRNAQASLKDAQAQLRAGVGTQFDVLRSEVQVANAQQQLLGSQNQSVVAQRNLASLLNFLTPTDVKVEEVVQSGTWDLEADESIFRALNDRTELQQFEAQQRSSEAQADFNRRSQLPSVVLSASYFLFNDLNFRNVGFFDGYTFRAQLTWSIYDGGAAYARAEQAHRTSQIAQAQFQDTKNTIRLGVETSYFTLRTSQQQITTARKAQGQAEESLRLARLRFRAGVGTQTDVIAAETALTQAQVNLLQAIISYNRSLAELRRSLNLL
ncbi:TolC family protein [Anthocerotibacter panamensis]|uniref:TolC family protein n=1 Tax=Anthocerotibacter panamensis TaxID=2857077 RepID=UPI001C4014CD|nr:TolC family protein [Anthocerotibacter panamensis]